MDPTLGAIIVAGIAALGSVAGAAIALKNSGKLNIIHTLTNSNLTEIRARLEMALRALRQAQDELDALRRTKKTTPPKKD